MQSLIDELHEMADPERAAITQRFFKTGKGEYGEGDIFIGIRNPDLRTFAKKHFKTTEIAQLDELIKNEVHEIRLAALFILVCKFEKSKSDAERAEIVRFYLRNTSYINNWDMVDTSAPQILGRNLYKKPKDQREVLYKLAKSDNLWEQRISIIATMYFIKKDDYSDTLKLAEMLLYHRHDLMHKAVGWMLREVGKRNLETELQFLRKYYKTMPRTTLRYAIEKLDEPLRKDFLEGRV